MIAEPGGIVRDPMRAIRGLVVGVVLAGCRTDGDVVRAPVGPPPPPPAPAPQAPPAPPAEPEGEDEAALRRPCAPAMSMDHAPGNRGLFAFEDASGMWGYRDAKGRVVIPPRFRFVYEMSKHGVAGAIDAKGRPVFLDERGAVLAEALLFDNGPDYFQAGYARIVERGKVGFLDEQGRVAIAPRWDYAGAMCQGRAVVCLGCVRQKAGEHDEWRGGKWGFIDTRGREVIPLVYDQAEGFADGVADVVKGGKRRTIDRAGAVVSRPAP